ncbi:MAG: polysaccharide deacetylase family protein [Sedimentisphaerales bacterium]|nr:polysaccharide deacetylase family protein [Sedimentisphaerales bacterium]
MIGAIFWYLFTLGGRFGRGEVIVLCYHGIKEYEAKAFQWQMTHIANRTLSASALTKEGRLRFGRRPKVCVTFDDAFSNLFDNAFPTLRQLDICATVFIPTGNLGAQPAWEMPLGHPEAGERVMTEEEIMQMLQDSHLGIGSHSRTHARLTSLSGNQLNREMIESKQELERLTGRQIWQMALPHGSFDDHVILAAKEAGYRQIFTLVPMLFPNSDKEVIGRFSMSPSAWRIEYFLTCAGGYTWIFFLRKLIKSLCRLGTAKRRFQAEHMHESQNNI